MNAAIDQHCINHMTVAVHQAMTPQENRRSRETDTMFLGGGQPTDADRQALGHFALDKNYRLVVPCFDTAEPQAGPVGYDVICTDGLEQSIALTGGRLWRRDRRSTAVLLFPSIGVVVKLTGKGCMLVREMKGCYHDQGYELARQAVLAHAARQPGSVPVLTSVGALTVVLDMRAFAATFAVAA